MFEEILKRFVHISPSISHPLGMSQSTEIFLFEGPFEPRMQLKLMQMARYNGR